MNGLIQCIYKIKQNNFSTSQFVDYKTFPELKDIVTKYEPEVIWSDGDWETTSKYWKATEFLAWYATNSTVAKTAVWNDRWGTDSTCKHGSFVTCSDRFLPNKVQEKKWENALTITKTSWGYDRSLTLESYYTTKYLIHTLIQTVAFNGNMLLNVGPRADGTLDPIFEQRLLEIGLWLSVNGEAIYKTQPWNIAQNETASHVFYTVAKKKSISTTKKVLYALFTEWPDNNQLHLESVISTRDTHVRMLGLEKNESLRMKSGKNRHHKHDDDDHDSHSQQKGLTVLLPPLTPSKIPCQHAWVVAITGIGNSDATSSSSLTSV